MGGKPLFTARTVAMTLLAALGAVGVGACSKDQGSQAAFCRQIRTVPPLASVISGYANEDPTELQSRLGAARLAYTQLGEAAPKEIADDVEISLDLVEAVIDAVATKGDDPEAVAAQIRRVVKADTGASAASTRVADYAEKNCNVDLNPTVPPDAGARATTTGATTSTTN
ncbi:MAG: hypothetical protein ABIP03_15715 [Aquihabitans sp.]